MIAPIAWMIALTLLGGQPAQKAQPVEDAEKRHMRLIAEFHAAVPDKAGRITLTVPIDVIRSDGKYAVIEEHGTYTGAQYQKNQELFDHVEIRIAASVADRIK